VQHLFQAGVHFFLFNELAPVGLRNTFPPSRTKAGLFLKQAQSCVLHQSLSVGACVGGDLRKLRFLLRREMYFDPFKMRQSLGSGKLLA